MKFTNKISSLFTGVLLLSAVLFTGCATNTEQETQMKFEFIVEKGRPTSIVETLSGPVQGENLNGVNRFLGIPYAQSIAGQNRFKPPQAVEPWSEVFIADRYADSSPQQSSLDPTMSTPVDPAFQPPAYVVPGDDCLALNIWTPENADGTLPVMVWLHGGGWTTGSGSCAIYEGENLASRGDVIVVTINHRLGLSGLTDFSRVLGGDFSDSSNLSVKDMKAALEWVRDNISAFGGNPELVTIFGESGGGWKVNTMLGVPSAKGLFDRAIVESGPLTRFLTPEEADELAETVLEALGITAEDADKLYELSTADIIAAEERVLSSQSMSDMMGAPGFPTGFWPVIDGELILDHVYTDRAAAAGADVPLMIGTNGTEFTLFMLGDRSAFNLGNFGLGMRTSAFFGLGNSSDIIDSYRADFPEYDASGIWFRLLSDFMMGTLTSEIMDVRAATPGSAPVYAFRFDWLSPMMDGKLYSPHTMEIPFVFDNATNAAGTVMTNGGEDVARLSKAVSSAWVEFAKTGKPAAEGLPEWPAYTTGGREAMHLNNESTVFHYMDPAMVELFHERLWDMAGMNE